MMLNFGVWMLMCHITGLITGYCLYGNSSDCAFQCHCAIDSECSQGTCQSGCDKAPLGYNWRGPACQIGNVGLLKPANMTVQGNYTRLYPATAALDGVITGQISSNCAHPSTPNTPAEWWTDLGDVYKIFNITIFGRTDCCPARLQQFNLTVYNTSDNEVLCGYHQDSISNYSTIRCTKPVIGRYVHFKRVGGPDITLTALCEVVIIGHKYIDCSRCPLDVSCNDAIGCEACSGSYQPDCKQTCEEGFYGTNCKHKCGKCKKDTKCDQMNGACYDGCQIWWTNTKCDKYIELRNHSDEKIILKSKTSSSIQIEWQHIKGISQDLFGFYGYLIQYKDKTTNSAYLEAGTVNYNSEPSFLINNLTTDTNYDIEIKPFRKYETKKEFGTSYDTLEVKTNCTNPQSVTVLNVTILNDNKGLPNISVTWTEVSNIEANCDDITKLYLFYKLKTSSDYTTVDLNLDVTNFVIVPREEGEYEIKLVVENNEGYTSHSSIYRINVNENRQSKVTTSSPKTTTIIISASVIAVVIVAVIVIVITTILLRRRKSRTRAPPSVHDNDAFQCDTINHEEGNVVINGVDMRVVTKDTKRNKASRQTVDIMGANSTYEFQQAMADQEVKENSLNLAQENVAVYSNVGVQPDDTVYANSAVSVKSFAGYVTRRKQKMQEFSDEFKTLPEPDLSRCIAAQTTDNKDKNRYRSIFAYDDTRVRLGEGGGSDYINATYITGYNRKREYIATQAPTNITKGDFWQMIWQEEATSIVMVANVSEGGRKKAERYWPDEIGESLKEADFEVTTEGLQSTADWSIRIMTLKNKDGCRTIRQFHFTSWQDKDKPLHGNHTLLAFVDKVHSFDNVSNGPLIVHCSAGVGRTGTFIALDILRQMAVKQESVDVYNCVKKLRQERMLMVQTMAQYVYLHDILVDFIKCGNRSISCTEFQTKFATICSRNPDKHTIALIKKEFEILKDIKKSADNRKKAGLKPANIKKNRNINIVPNESGRQYLSRSNTGNYINAVSIDSFKAHDSYIVTQMPLPHTISDFWQLIVEKGCQVIVMLNEMDNEDETCLQYWPEAINTEQVYGKITVKFTSVSHENYLTVRDFKVTEKTAKKTFFKPDVLHVRQFQLLSWPQDKELPPDRADLLHLMETIQDWQLHNQISANNWNPLVHCIDGGSRSGMFCGASFMIEKMKIDQEFDAFLAVRYVTRHRPEFFTELHEYQFLYQMAMEYLNKHNEYSNFR